MKYQTVELTSRISAEERWNFQILCPLYATQWDQCEGLVPTAQNGRIYRQFR